MFFMKQICIYIQIDLDSFSVERKSEFGEILKNEI